ncbi:MAG: DUF898 family protein [Candidatus Rokuibacteriota bacterium]
MADTCPKCGFAGVESDKCPSCNVIIPLYRSYLEKLRRGPQQPAAVPTPVTRTPVVAAVPAATRSFTPPRPAMDTPAEASPRPAEARSHRPRFHGGGGSLFGIHIVNALLTLVTLGFYYFWGKVRVRRYIFSQTEFEGDRFAYHGTGWELLNGMLKASLVFGIPIVLLNILPDLLDAGRLVRVVTGLGMYAIVLVFVPVAIVGARRYRLSRTSWRGLRFSFRGRATEFMRIFIPGSLLTGLTLGLYYPIFLTRQQAYLVSRSHFGTRAFAFEGKARELFKSFLLTLLLTVPTLGLAWVWFLARKRRLFWSATSFSGARFHCTVTGGRLVGLWAVNVVLLVLTLGIAWPWVVVRNARFACANLTLEGPLDLAGIIQDAQAGTATGEALSAFLDADLGLG